MNTSENSNSTPSRLVTIEESAGIRFLVNRSILSIKKLVYSTASTGAVSDESTVWVSRRPYYEILDLPPRSRVLIEEIDPYEDGMVLFVLDEVEWEDGFKQTNENLIPKKVRHHFDPIYVRIYGPPVGKETGWDITEVEREKRLLRADEPVVYRKPESEDSEE